MESDEIKIVSYDDLKSYTGNFSEENFIGNCQFGKVYRGRIGEREVTVKIWRIPTLYLCYEGDNERRLVNEILLHGDFRLMSHPNMAKLIEYCDLCEDQLGVVYDFKSLNTLLHFVQQDDFTWQQRIRVAYQLACLLSFLHNPTITQKPHFDYLPYMVLNLSPNHIMLDQDYNPILYDFSLLSGGVLSDRNPVEYHMCGCIGYMDFNTGVGFWECGPDNDIFSFAMILIGLMTKKVFIPEAYIYKSIIDDEPYLQKLELIIDDAPCLDEWARDEYEKRKISFGEGNVSLVDECFEQDPVFEASDAVKITELLMLCMVYDFKKRPSSEKIVGELEKLKVMQRHPKTLGVKQSEYMLRYSSHYGLLKIMEEGASNRVIELLKKYLSHP